MSYNDMNMLSLLSCYKANFNRNYFSLGSPLFFHAETVEVAQLFFDHGVNLNVSTNLDTNVLWHCCWSLYGSENIQSLVQFYLDKKVDPRVVDQKKRCLLHAIAWKPYIGEISESYKESVKLLLNLLSDMINTLDIDDNTPLDLLYEKRFKYSQDEDIIALFKAYGAKAAQELHQ